MDKTNQMLLNRILTLLFLLLGASVFGQYSNFKNFSVKDGLAQSQIYAIHEDSKGYLWLGTRGGGISKFDGETFETFNTSHGLVSNYILSIHEDPNGVLWIGTSAGLCSYDGDSFTPHQLKNRNNLLVADIAWADNKLWVGTNKGLFYKADSVFKEVDAKKYYRNAVTVITPHPEGGLWLGSDLGLVHLKDGKSNLINTRDGLNSNFVKSVSYDQSGALWVGTYGGGINVIDSAITNFNPVLGFNGARNVTLSIHHTPDGYTWISSPENGVYRWNPIDSTMSNFQEKEGLANNNVRTITTDSWGNLWIGTSGGGLSKYAGQEFEAYTTRQGLNGNYIYAICPDSNALWVSTSAKGVTRIKNNKYVHYNLDSGFANIKTKALFRQDTLLWLGTEGNGIYRFDGDTFLNFNVDSGLSGNWIKDIVADTPGNLYLATSGGGITKMSWIDSSYVYKRINRRLGLASNRVTHLLKDQDNRIWYATNSNGIGCLINDSTILNYSVSNGLTRNSIRSLALSKDNILFIGTAGNGVNYTFLGDEKLTFKSITSSDGLSSDNVYLLEVDTLNNLWIGTERGVDKLSFDESGAPLTIDNYSQDEGFAGVETVQNAAATDFEGNVWLGTINGLYKYVPGSNFINKKPPILNITKVSLFYNSIADTPHGIGWKWDEELVLPFDQNHLTFDFRGNVLTVPKKVRYRWKLVGAEDEWSPASDKRSITYSNLNPGSYTFMVSSMNEDGVWNKTGQTIRFKILPPFWMEVWFIVSSSLLLIIFIFLIVTMRLRKVKRRARDIQEKLRMENEMLTLEQKALRLQMNPHFIFNCLNTIQALIVKKDEKTARFYLSKFSKLMRQILDNSRAQAIPLDEEIKTLENYLAIEKFCSGDHFEYEITLGDELAPDFIDVPPMILQPFVENAIVHGVSHLENGGRIMVDFKLEDEALICTIEDNGVGRERAAAFKNQQSQLHKSKALIITQERLAMLNPNHKKQAINITDLPNHSGTKITLIIASN